MDLVFGILAPGGADETVLRRMADAFRGAPGRARAVSLHRDGALAMGRLSIGAHEAAPATTGPDGVTVADARLYDVPQLSAPLEADTATRETALAACLSAGPEGPKGLAAVEGDFALAHWDGRRLTLARDAMGVRPLFYAPLGAPDGRPGEGGLAFASLPEMLIGAGLAGGEPDRALALSALLANFPHMGATLLPGLMRVPPAHALVADRKGARLHRYWQLTPGRALPRDADFAACARELRDRLDAAVRRRLGDGEEVGSHVSSGLDCGSVAVLAARHLAKRGARLHAYTLVPAPHPGLRLPDERVHADAVVQSEPNIYGEKVPAPEHDPRWMERRPDALAVGMPAEVELTRRAARDGVDVILSGWGGDEGASFNGRGVYAEHFVRMRWRTLWREINARSRRTGGRRRGVFVSEVLACLMPAPWLARLASAMGGNHRPMANHRLGAVLGGRGKLRSSLAPGPNARLNRHALLTNGHIAHRLEAWARDGAEHGVRYAFPLLDRALLDYVLRLPSHFFLRQGRRRAIFREAMRGVLPETVRQLDRKRLTYPDVYLRLADRREEFAARLEALRADPAAAGRYDLDALAAIVADIPSREDVVAALEAEVDGGPSPNVPGVIALAIFDLIDYLDAPGLQERRGDHA